MSINNNHFKFWSNRRNEDFHFMDDTIREFYLVSGLGTLIYKYTGIMDQGEKNDPTLPNNIAEDGYIDETSIQDTLYLENRDKTYDLSPYEISGIYSPQDNEFDLKQFGLFLDNDNIYITYHYNEMIEKLGRKIMAGDIIEFPNMRDYNPLDSSLPSFPKFYTVNEATVSAEGVGATWYYHLWRVKCSPLTDSQEYSQFLSKEDEQTGFDLSTLSDYNINMEISDSIQKAALQDVPFRNFETNHFYIVPNDELGTQYPWIWAGDGLPPNGAVLAATGNGFPDQADEGTYFLNTGFEPHILYRKEGYRWKIMEYDWRREMSSAHRILETFINNNNKTKLQTPFTPEDDEFNEKQYLSKVIKPRADFNDQNGPTIEGMKHNIEGSIKDTRIRKKIKPPIDKG